MPGSITGLWGSHGGLQNTLPGMFLLRNGVTLNHAGSDFIPSLHSVSGWSYLYPATSSLAELRCSSLGRPGVRVTRILFMGPASLGMGLPGSTTVGVCPPPVTQGGLAFMEALWLLLSSSKEMWPWVGAVCTHWTSKCHRLHTVNQFLCPPCLAAAPK